MEMPLKDLSESRDECNYYLSDKGLYKLALSILGGNLYRNFMDDDTIYKLEFNLINTKLEVEVLLSCY